MDTLLHHITYLCSMLHREHAKGLLVFTLSSSSSFGSNHFHPFIYHTVIQYLWKIGLHLSKGRHGLFKMRNDFSLSFVQKGETGTDVYAEVLIN